MKILSSGWLFYSILLSNVEASENIYSVHLLSCLFRAHIIPSEPVIKEFVNIVAILSENVRTSSEKTYIFRPFLLAHDHYLNSR